MSNVTKLLVYIDVSVGRIKSSAVFEIHKLVGGFLLSFGAESFVFQVAI